MRALLLIALLFTYGCTTMDQRAIISPSESLYYKANEFYENKEFYAAIDLYEQYLETKPRSSLSVPAKLNLGMSHFYNASYKEAYTTLKDLDQKDENIKAYVDTILKTCEAEAGDEIKAEEQAKQAAVTAQASAGSIEIEVLDVYLDDFGSVVLKGKTSIEATVIVNNDAVTLDKTNTFTASVSWKKGNSISITAKDASGASGELSYFPDGESPEEPESLRVVNTSSNSAEIEWDKNYADDIKGYRLYFRLKGGSTREVPDLIEDTKYEVVGLANYVEGSNKTFEFYLRAVDKMNNESEDSDILEVTIP